jgi:hypothetical protein
MLRRRPHRKDSVGHPSPKDERSSEDDDDNENHPK